ncbi:hypothetical protein N2152v2_000617 [Parachlorella kessleri]
MAALRQLTTGTKTLPTYIDHPAWELVEGAKLRALEGAGAQRVAEQHARGRLTARERLQVLLDPGTFLESGALVQQRSFGLHEEQQHCYGEGVVTGSGRVYGRPVFVFSQDHTTAAGAGSPSGGLVQKICRTIDRAVEVGAPVIGLYDSGRSGVERGDISLPGYGEIYQRQVDASGVVPQISLVMGPCVGEAVLSAALTDVTLKVTWTQAGGMAPHTVQSGVVPGGFDSELEALADVRELLAFLPLSASEAPPRIRCTDPEDRLCPYLDYAIPQSQQEAYDMKDVIEQVVDEGQLFEIQADYARGIITGFARLGGSTVGVVANQPQVPAGCLDGDACAKAARFVQFCDAFNVPLITFMDEPGGPPGTTAQETDQALVRHGAKLVYAYAQATVPTLTVITRNASGGATDIVAGNLLRADVKLSWPFGRAGNKSSSPLLAAAHGVIDEVIFPRYTRARLCRELDLLRGKRVARQPLKHGNPPL